MVFPVFPGIEHFTDMDVSYNVVDIIFINYYFRKSCGYEFLPKLFGGGVFNVDAYNVGARNHAVAQVSG